MLSLKLERLLAGTTSTIRGEKQREREREKQTQSLEGKFLSFEISLIVLSSQTQAFVLKKKTWLALFAFAFSV